MITIRPYQIQDRSRLLGVIDAVCAECTFMETTHYTPTPSWESALQAAAGGSSCLLVAFLEGKSVGWCRLFPLEEHDPTRLELGIGVLASARRIGIGKLLMRGALDWAQESGANEIHLNTALENAPARGLFRQFGFISKGQHEDRLQMVFPLPSFARPA